MYRISVVAKALVGDTFHSALYVQLGARTPNGDFIQGAGKGMPSKLDQDALGAYAAGPKRACQWPGLSSCGRVCRDLDRFSPGFVC